MAVRVQVEDFNVGDEIKRLQGSRKDIGAVVSFVGLVRDINDGDAVAQLTLEHYPGMTEKSLSK
ncbi:MAG: molybdenum cofactor biosynthesis protein MoaE, partial [Methylotenera sp.]